MKIGLYTDVHFSETKSMINKYSQNSIYSDRLDSCINSLKWTYKTFKDNNVDLIVNAGDFFDKTSLSAQEISALSEIDYPTTQEYHLVGNHEMLSNNSELNSANIFSSRNNTEIVRDIEVIHNPDYDVNILLIPYSTDIEYSNNKIKEIVNDKIKINLVISHNYFTDINYGPYKVNNAIELDIFKSKDIPIFNGHIHNAIDIGNYHQIGSLMGSGFGDNYEGSYPNILIYDTDTMSIERVENPCSHIFINIKNPNTISDLKSSLDKLPDNKKLVRVTVSPDKREYFRNFLNKDTENKYNIYYSEVISKDKSVSTSSEVDNVDVEVLVDSYESSKLHLIDYIKSKGDSELPTSKSTVVKFINDRL